MSAHARNRYTAAPTSQLTRKREPASKSWACAAKAASAAATDAARRRVGLRRRTKGFLLVMKLRQLKGEYIEREADHRKPASGPFPTGKAK
jgi:hypothetical protein